MADIIRYYLTERQVDDLLARLNDGLFYTPGCWFYSRKNNALCLGHRGCTHVFVKEPEPEFPHLGVLARHDLPIGFIWFQDRDRSFFYASLVNGDEPVIRERYHPVFERIVNEV